MASHLAPTVAIKLLFLAYLLFATDASRTTLILATEFLFFVGTLCRCTTQTWLSAIGPPTTRRRRIQRRTVGIVLPFCWTLAYVLGFLKQFQRHAGLGNMGYTVEQTSAYAGFQVSVWTLYWMTMALVSTIVIYEVATGQQRRRRMLELYDSLFLFIMVIASASGLMRMGVALPYVLQAPSDEFQFLALMHSLLRYRAVVSFLNYARDVLVGFEEEEVPL